MNTTFIDTVDRKVPVPVEQADDLIEGMGFTEEVEDYECNELGHVYILKDGSRLVIDGPLHVHYFAPSSEK